MSDIYCIFFITWRVSIILMHVYLRHTGSAIPAGLWMPTSYEKIKKRIQRRLKSHYLLELELPSSSFGSLVEEGTPLPLLIIELTTQLAQNFPRH